MPVFARRPRAPSRTGREAMMMRMTRGILVSSLAAAAIALSFAAGIARADPQPQPPNAMTGFSQNHNAPVQINAQSLEVRDKKHMAIYSGNVVLVQGDTTLRCKTLVVYYDGGQAGGRPVKASTSAPAGNQQIRRIEATGGVVMTQKGQTATGEKAIYDISDDTVRLFPAPGGTVAITQGPNVVQGQRLVVHLDTGLSHIEGARSLIVPNSTKGQNQPAAPAPRSAPKPRATSRPSLY
jgi:lipopolysaccharide export system protein LptA